jgi:transcriptional regulator GlxA family with amidase domain
MRITALIFDQLTPLDIVGPVEVLSRLPGADILVVAPEARPIQDSRTRWVLMPDRPYDQAGQADVLVIPGGPGVDQLIEDERLLRWVQRQHEQTTWTTSVCTGALVLAAAGLLAGRRAATHWQSRAELAGYGVDVLAQRVVQDGKIITSAGVSAGIDMAFVLAANIAGQAAADEIRRAIAYEDVTGRT